MQSKKRKSFYLTLKVTNFVGRGVFLLDQQIFLISQNGF